MTLCVSHLFELPRKVERGAFAVKLKMKNVFWRKSDDKVLKGEHLNFKISDKVDIPILKIKAKTEEEVLHNNQLIRGDDFITDHLPIKVFFFVK